MAGFGSALVGFGQAYPKFQEQQQTQEMNRINIQKALTDMNNAAQTRAAYGPALTQFSQTKGTGPGGTVTPQQLAALSQNPDVFAALNSANRPANTGLYNLEGRSISGDYGLQRADTKGQYDLAKTDAAGKNAMERTQVQQEGANTRNDSNIEAHKDIVDTQQKGAGERNAATNASRIQRILQGPRGASLSPEYRAAAKIFDETSQLERSIMNNYGRMGNFQGYLNDPQWIEARKRKIEAQKTLNTVSTKHLETLESGKDTQPAAQAIAPAGVTKIATDDDFNKLASGTQFIDPEGNLRTKP